MHTILLAALHMSIAWTLGYIMDDTNQTIQYSPPERWMGVSCSDCFGETEYALVLYSCTCHCTHPWITEYVILMFIVIHFDLV